MRRLTALPVIIILSVTFLTRPLIAQQPTKEEMQEMQKMMQQMKSDPEMQKAMQQFGIDMKTVENTMNGEASEFSGSYYEFDEFQTPERAVERIASIPKKPLTTAGLPAFLSAVENCVNASIAGADREMVDLLLNKAGTSPDDLANMASALWMSGKYIPAAYLMGKACQLNPGVTNLNNYSAFLVMTGGEELALPVLQKLNRENPKNSIILNNIGQAWFGLGDLDKAKSYLDSTTMIFATHSQANQTKCVIQESKGDRAGAAESMKLSVKGAYTPTKEAMLRKLGFKVEGGDMDNSALHMPADPLGFARWMALIPPFPRNYKEQMLLAPRWKDFYQTVQDEQTRLQEKAGRLNIEYADSLVKRQKRFAANPYQNQFKDPYMSARASKVLKYYTDDRDGHNAEKARQIADAQMLTMTNMEKYRKDAYQKYSAIMKKFGEEVGEGKPVPPSTCPEAIAIYNSYVNSANSELEAFTMDYLKFIGKQLEANAYFTQYITDLQPLIDYNETSMKLRFLVDLSNIKPVLDYQNSMAWGCIQNEIEEAHEDTHKMADWDDLHCDRDITFSIRGIGSYHFTCNTTSLDLDPLILPFKASFEQNLNTGEFVNASGKVGYGPVKVGGEYDFVKEQGSASVEVSGDVIDEEVGGVKVKAGVSGKATLEFDKNGLSGFEMEASGEAKVGNDAVKVSGDASVSWSWEAGGSGEAKGSIDSKALSTAIKAVNLIK